MKEERSLSRRTVRDDSIEIDCIESVDGGVILIVRNRTGRGTTKTVDPLEQLRSGPRRGPKRVVQSRRLRG
jgi:hypothetical protein